MELGNAAIKEPRYHVTRVAYCEEYLRLFGGEEEGIAQGMRRAMAESIDLGGNPARADALYEEWLAVDPRWGWGWIGWSDNYSIRSGRAGKELPKAEAILKRGLAWADVGIKTTWSAGWPTAWRTRIATRRRSRCAKRSVPCARPMCRSRRSLSAAPFPRWGGTTRAPAAAGKNTRSAAAKAEARGFLPLMARPIRP